MLPERRPFWPWLLLGLALSALAVALAPGVYRVLVDLGWVDPTRTSGGDPFGKVLRRLLLVPVAVVVFAGLKPWRDLTWAQMGLVGPAARAGPGWRAFGLTLLAVGLVLALHVALGWLVLHRDDAPARVAWRLVKTLGTAVVVGAIEEWFFRAWLPWRLSRACSARLATLLSIAVFAAVHAFRSTRLKDPIAPDLSGALQALGTWFTTLVDPVAFGPAFLGLALFGVLLTAAYRRTGSLWTPIGIHAAGIWALLSYGAFTERQDTPAWAGTKVLYDGVPGWALLLLATWALCRRAHTRNRSGGSSP